jgi:hypothetical protein
LYEAVQLEAGILGGRLYLGAYAQHLGATGLTFYDDDVVRFFSPHAADRSTIFLVAVGKSAKISPSAPVCKQFLFVTAIENSSPIRHQN